MERESLLENGLIHSFDDSNEELLRRCNCNDESALRELLHRHERPVYSLLYRMLGSHEDAEEALADVFVKVWKSAGSFRGASKFTTWLYRIAGNTARDALRYRKARPETTIDNEIIVETDIIGISVVDPEKELMASDERTRIDQAIQRLSDEDRLIVTLYHIHENTLDEIAEITRQNRANLKVKLFRARQRLRKHLGDLDREINDEMFAGTTESFGLQPGAS